MNPIRIDTTGDQILFTIFILSFIGVWIGVKFHRSNFAVWVSILSTVFIAIYSIRVLEEYFMGILFALFIPLFIFKTNLNRQLDEYEKNNEQV